MKSEDVIEIIDTICDKLGIVVDSATGMIPELAKHEIAISLFWVIVSPVIILISIKAILFTVGKAKKDIEETTTWGKRTIWDYPSVIVVSAIAGILIAAFAFALLFEAENLVSWIISPEASVIEFVLEYKQW